AVIWRASNRARLERISCRLRLCKPRGLVCEAASGDRSCDEIERIPTARELAPHALKQFTPLLLLARFVLLGAPTALLLLIAAIAVRIIARGLLHVHPLDAHATGFQHGLQVVQAMAEHSRC